MRILGIDPGMTVGVAVLDTDARTCTYSTQTTDDDLLDAIKFEGGSRGWVGAIVAELWINYGRPPGQGSRLAIGQAYWLQREHGAHMLSRPDVIRILGMGGSVGKAAVWGEVVRMLGSDQRGKLCPRRGRKGHTVTGREGLASWSGSDPNCPACNGTGYEREPGPLAHVKGHARDALALAVAWAIRSGELIDKP